MNTQQISKALKGHPVTKVYFEGVFASDRLPDQVERRPCCMVCNTDIADGPGEHWVAIFFCGDGTAEYFDSYGQLPQVSAIRLFLEKHSSSWKHNTKTLQGMMSSACGQHCLYFLFCRCRDQSLEKTVGSLPDSPFVCDSFVVAFVNKYLHMSTEVYEEDIVINQLCTAFGV